MQIISYSLGNRDSCGNETLVSMYSEVMQMVRQVCVLAEMLCKVDRVMSVMSGLKCAETYC